MSVRFKIYKFTKENLTKRKESLPKKKEQRQKYEKRRRLHWKAVGTADLADCKSGAVRREASGAERIHKKPLAGTSGFLGLVGINKKMLKGGRTVFTPSGMSMKKLCDLKL